VISGVEGTFPQLSVYGSDAFSEGLAYAAERLKNAELFQMDAREIPFKDEFDVIGAFDVLEHIKEDGTILSQVCQAVRQGGGIILTVPQHPFLWSRYDEDICHVRRYTYRDLRRKVEIAGFKVQRMSSFVSLLFPLMVISRWNKWRPDSEFDVLAGLNTSGLMNMLLEKVLDIERAFIRLGLSFPVGGSLLLIAYKI
jgi:SAM-dependent methyltransferase